MYLIYVNRYVVSIVDNFSRALLDFSHFVLIGERKNRVEIVDGDTGEVICEAF
jgi:hypothetical protein